MRIRAISNRAATLPESVLTSGLVRREQEYPVTIGREYTVFAITVEVSHVWFYIVDDDQHPWPLWYPGPLFELSDPRLSRYWKFGYRPRDDESRTGRPRAGAEFAFPEWIDQPMFLERLTDNLEPEVSVFADYKRLMEAEFE
jgi:hypothetical protein